MTAPATRTIQETKPLTILQRLVEKDKTAVTDCLDAYGNFIWALARKFTASSEEAEAAAQEILLIFGDMPNAKTRRNLPKIC